MAKLNLSLNFLTYLDSARSANPAQRMSDLKFSMLGIPTEVPRQLPIHLAPLETLTFANNTRSLTFSGSTSFDIQLVTSTSNVRLVGAFVPRTARGYGDATTQWIVSRTSATTRLTATGVGTAASLSGAVVGDGLTIESGSAFNALNWGDFVINKVGVGYVEFQHPTSVGETVAALVKIYSTGAVQVGDTLDLTAAQFLAANRGQFPVLRVTDQYIEFTNASAVAESGKTGVTTGLSVYTSLYKWLLMAVDKRVIVRLNADAGSSVEVEPPVDSDLSANPGLYLKRGRVYQVDVYNPGNEVVSGFILLAE